MLSVETDPAEAGFAPERLTRIDRHYQRYVDEGKLPGFLALIAREGQIVHIAKGGLRDVEAGLPVELDTQFRIYSMTKPITSVAAMLLWEEGAFELNDPVERFIPAFKDARVWAGLHLRHSMRHGVPCRRSSRPRTSRWLRRCGQRCPRWGSRTTSSCPGTRTTQSE